MQDQLQGEPRGQHFLLSAQVRDFTLWDAANLSEVDCFLKFVELRWGSLDEVICPSCGGIGHQRPSRLL